MAWYGARLGQARASIDGSALSSILEVRRTDAGDEGEARNGQDRDEAQSDEAVPAGRLEGVGSGIRTESTGTG